MEIREMREGALPMIKVSGVENFDVGKIFDCGQCFRFENVENSNHEKEFSGIAFGRHISFGQDGKDIYIYGSDVKDFEGIWRRYLDIDRDYNALAEETYATFPSDILREAMEYGRGIRILAQEPFEAVISFIISQNNNIPRIKKIIEALSKNCGGAAKMYEGYEKHDSGKSSLCAFPTAEALVGLGVEGLAALRTGFRAKYIYDGASRVLDGSLDLSSVAALEDTEAAIEKLCEVKGIGRKVASCALLFGFGKYDAFPIDVWMKRVAEKYFPEHANDFSPTLFGKYAGVAQQYLFYYERYNSK
jgi:N-glycosylase/DNA lyase